MAVPGFFRGRRPAAPNLRRLFRAGRPIIKSAGLPEGVLRRKGGSCVTVVYLDSVFTLNAVMDYLLLICTARLAGRPLRRGRYLLAALLGGAYAAAVFLPGLSFLARTPVKLAAGILLALAAFGGEEKLVRLTLLFFALSCALAGCVLGLGLLSGGVPMAGGIFYTDVDARVLLIAAAAAYAVMTVVFRAAAKHGVEGQLLRVRVCLKGQVVTMTALHDTGNALCDPVSGAPVLVTARGALENIFPPQVRRLLTPERLRCPAELLEPLRASAPEWRFSLVPYQTVGLPEGLLLTVRSDWTEVGGTRYRNLPVGICAGGVGEDCAALWGGSVKGRGLYETGMDETAGTAGAVGTAAAGPGALHRRQRYPAAATDKRTGGGAPCPSGGGGGPAGAHRT